MYSTCLHCTRSLGVNDLLEWLPIGRRVAFDGARGRLWVICGSCGRWNLVPFDKRLEAIDDCERLFRDTRTRYSTDNIGLARTSEGLELVRIGAPQRPEFASWRYGRQFRKRRRKNMAIGAVGLAIPAAGQLAASLSLGPASGSLLGGVLISAGALFGVSWLWQTIDGRRTRVLARVNQDEPPTVIRGDLLTTVHVAARDGQIALSWNPGVLASMRKRVVTIEGPDAVPALRRVLGSLNRNVGSRSHLSQAVEHIERGGVDTWLEDFSHNSQSFLSIPSRTRISMGVRQAFTGISRPTAAFHYPGFDPASVALYAVNASERLALEMWLSEADDARALSGELALLEREWKEADELARIADGLAIQDDQTR